MRKTMACILAFATVLAAGNAEPQSDPREAALRAALADAESSPAIGDRTVALVNTLGVLLLDQGRYAEAENEFRRAVDLSRSAFGANHRATAIALGNLVNALTSV